MPIISNPRQIRIDLDPNQGFPVGLSVESTRHIEESGERIADLAPHVESLAPDSEQAKAVLGELASAATAALLPYQAEAQRLGAENASLRTQIIELGGML